MERQKILNPLTGRMVYADGVVGKSIPKMKKKVGVLEGAIKRTLAKKPEPKKVYGWEDLPDDIKDKISGIVKKNKKIDYNAIRKYVMNVKEYYLLPNINLTKEEIQKMGKKDLYDLAYNGKLDKMIYYEYLHSWLGDFNWKSKGFVLEKDNDGNIRFSNHNLLIYPDYGDNLKLFNYLVNHPVNEFSYDGDTSQLSGFFLFKGDDVNTNGSNVEEYEYLTAVEENYYGNYKDENGIWLARFLSLYNKAIPKKIFRIKLQREPKREYVTEEKDYPIWKEELEKAKQFGFEYNEDKTILEFKREIGVLPRISGRRKPNFKKP